MIAISFALPEESKDLVRIVSGARRSGPAALPVVTGRIGGREIAILHTGMGMASAATRVGSFLQEHKPATWVAAGFGGALSTELQVGDVIAVRNFSDAMLLQCIASLPAKSGILVTAKSVVETAEQKKDLGRHTGAIVVDMETAEIHRSCVAQGIPLLAIRAISDTASEDLPVKASIWFDMRTQRPRPLPLVLHLARHPARILQFAKFVGGIGRARARLTAFLLAALDQLPEK